MIPAAIQAPQAVAETINSFCPPGLSVAPVGTTIALYRGASKTPFASFAYTGPDSVLGIVVATWRIALADHGQPVTNIMNVTTATAEEMKGLADALDILGWNRACEPTAWVRSYLNIEQIKLSEAREATEVAERRAAQIANDAMPAGYKLVSYHQLTEAGATTVYHWVTPTEEGPKIAAPAEALRGAWEQVATGDRERALGFLDALCVIGYHPDMNLDEWTEARVKQRDATESRVRVLESEVAALRDSEQRAVEASVRQSKTSEDALRILGWNGEDHPEKWAHDKSRAIQEALTEARHQRDRAAQHESDIGVITQAYFAAGFGPSPATPGGIASALDKARRRGDALRALGWDGLVDPETWARHCPTENETLAQIRGALLEALGLAEQGTTRPIIELIEQIVAREQEVQQNARRWRDSYEKLADALFGPGALSIPIERACVYAVEARRCVEESVAAIKSRPVDKEAPREPSPRTRWMAFQDAAVALGLQAYVNGATGEVKVTSPDARYLGRPAVVGVDHATGESVTCVRVVHIGGATVRYHDGKDSVEAPARAEQPKTVQTPLFAADGDSRFKVADARRWKRGASATQDRVGRVWATRISGSCVGMTGLPFKAGRTVRFVDAADKVVLAGEVLRYEAKHLGDRLEWEAEVLHEVLHEVNVAGHDATAGATAEKAGPRWTGITWMSKKGRAKTCRIEGLTFSAGPLTTVIKVPTSPYDLPTKLVRHIHGKKTLAFHVGSGKVITGIVDMVDASAISSMLLFVAT